MIKWSLGLFLTAFFFASQVRSVAPFSGNQFASSSKDCTIRIWQPKGGNVYECVKILEGHQQTIDKGGVGTLLWIPAGMHPNFTAGALCSGGYDRQICVWDGEGGLAPALSLIGHNGAVTCLALTQQGYLLSGSADKFVPFFYFTTNHSCLLC
jgi:WD40 repeat protein